MDTKLVQIAPISRIQLSAAVIFWIRVVIRDSFTARVIVGTQYSFRYFLWTHYIGCRDKANLYIGSRMTGKTQLSITSIRR